MTGRPNAPRTVGSDERLSAAKAAYRRLRGAHLRAVEAALEDHVARLDWSRERIERYQLARLRSLLAYAGERSPFHAARMGGLDPLSATVRDLAQLPVMTKGDAQQHWDAIVTAPRLSRDRAEQILADEAWFSYTPAGDQIFSSGGSSGVRGVYAWDWELFVTLACLAWRVQAREERRGPPLDRPARLAVVEAGFPPHASTPLFDVPSASGMETVVVPAGAPFAEVLAGVAAAQPTHLVGYASVVGRLARAALAGKLEIRPVRVSTNSEPLGDDDRDAIGAAWDVPIHNLWGSTEIGVQAVGCGRGDGLHICEDEVVLERVDDDGRRVAPGEPAGRTLATGLANRTFPFIRYDLGDEVTPLPGRCACGSALARVNVSGRRDDDFVYGSHTVPATVFRHVLGTDPRVSEYQVRQTPSGAHVLAVGSPDPATLTTAIADALRRHGIAEPDVEVSVVDRLDRHAATGKLRRFVAMK